MVNYGVDKKEDYVTDGWQTFFANTIPKDCPNPNSCVIKNEGCRGLLTSK